MLPLSLLALLIATALPQNPISSPTSAVNVSPQLSSTHCPRLLIRLEKNCDFTASDLQKKVPLHIVSGTKEEMREQINHLEHTSALHIILIENQDVELQFFARKVRYDFITLNEPFQAALSTLQSYIATVPLTEADLPHIDPHTVGKLYALMQKVDAFFSEHQIEYWATCGTLLGVARHKGIIPWDDDIDLAIHATDVAHLSGLEPELKKIGLQLCLHPEGNFLKIFPTDGLSIINPETNQPYQWKFPFVDIFPLVERDGKWSYELESYQKKYPHDYFLSEELIFTKVAFGPMQLPSPIQYKAYLSRAYGEDWEKVAYAKYSHEQEKTIKCVKVDLLNCDPAEFILP